MRTKLIILVALCVAGQAYANMIPLSVVRSLSVSGTAGGSSYSQTQSFSGFGTFDGNLAGAADSINSLGLFFHADSRASQTSSMSADEISANMILRGNTGISLSGPAGPVESRASSIFELTFSILTAQEYEITGSGFLFGHDIPRPNLDFLIASTTSGTILGQSSFFGTHSGILLPDTYTLRFDSDLSAQKDPLGDVQAADININLRVTSVSDAGSTGMLLGVTFVALITVYRKWARQEHVSHAESN